MKVFRIGSCRVFSINNIKNDVFEFNNESIGFTHTIRESIQLVNFLKGDKDIPKELLKYIYTFYGGDQLSENIEDIVNNNRAEIKEADVFLIEICSLKLLKYRDFYFQYHRYSAHEKLGIEPPDEEIKASVKDKTYSYDMFYKDIEELVSLLGDKKFIFTGHLNVKNQDGNYIESRETINKWLREICEEKGFMYYDLSSRIERNPKELISPDLVHLTPKALGIARLGIMDLLRR